MSRRVKPFRVGGGLNVVDPAIDLAPGRLTFSKNVELVPAKGGYRRAGGYERYDGRVGWPSRATYTRLLFSSGGVRPLQEGDVITGASSSATGVVIGDVDVGAGLWSAVSAEGEVRITNVDGTFESGEAIVVGGVQAAILTADPIPRALDDPDFKANLRAAQAYYRELIEQVPGEGKVLGVAVFDTKVYAFRNAVGGATACMFEATTAGWVEKKNGLAPNGRYEFRVHNFSGGASTIKLYGVSGVHEAFEWDGTTWTDLITGSPVDTPRHIAVLGNQLYLGFPGGSLQRSAAGDPTDYTVVWGAGEMGVGDEIVGLVENMNDTLTVYAANSVHVFYNGAQTGDGAAQLKKYSGRLGCQRWAAQVVGAAPVALDAKGAYLLSAAQTFGDFTTGMLSDSIRTLIESRPVNVRASVVSGTRAHYRVLFDDQTGLIATFIGSKLAGWTQVSYAHQFNCLAVGDDADGREVIFGGTDDGYVMHMDVGGSFDGEAIESIMRLPFNSFGYTNQRLRFYKLRLDIYSARPITLQVSSEFNYGGEGQAEGFDAVAPPSGGFWDQAVWEDFYWDAAVITTSEMPISGVGENIGLLIRHEDDIDLEFTLQAVAIQFDIWGLVR
jgi:hypothetical protein